MKNKKILIYISAFIIVSSALFGTTLMECLAIKSKCMSKAKEEAGNDLVLLGAKTLVCNALVNECLGNIGKPPVAPPGGQGQGGNSFSGDYSSMYNFGLFVVSDEGLISTGISGF